MTQAVSEAPKVGLEAFLKRGDGDPVAEAMSLLGIPEHRFMIKDRSWVTDLGDNITAHIQLFGGMAWITLAEGSAVMELCVTGNGKLASMYSYCRGNATKAALESKRRLASRFMALAKEATFTAE